MSGDIKLKAGGDFKEVLKGLDQANKRIVGLEKQLEKASAKSKKLSTEERAAAREAKKAFEEMQTPFQRHQSNVTKLTSAVKKGVISQDEFRAAVGKSKRELDASEKAGKRAFGPRTVAMIGGLTAAVSGGLLAAWRLVLDEVNAVAEAQRRAGQATMPLADAQAGALRNLGATTPEARDKFVADVEAMSDRTGVTERQIYQLASPALSAKGHLSAKQAMQSVEVAAEVAPDDVAVGEAFSGATLDLSKIAGTSAREGAGYLMSVGQKARVTDPGKMARSIGPALTAATSHEASLQTGGAMYAALTGSMVDETGEKTKTAVIKLADSLDEFLPKIATAHDRLKALQRDPALQEEFLNKYSFEVDAKEPIRQLVTGRGATAEAYGKFQAELPDPKQAGEFYQQWLQTFQGGALQVTSAMGRATEQLKEGLRTADQGAARIGLVTEDLKTTLQDAGMDALGSRLEAFGAKIQGNELSQVLAIFDRERARLADTHVDMTSDGPVERMPTPAELGKSSALSQFTAQIRAALGREAEDQATVRRSRAVPARAAGAKLPSRADWISGKISWEEATGLPPTPPVPSVMPRVSTPVPIRTVPDPPMPVGDRMPIGGNTTTLENETRKQTTVLADAIQEQTTVMRGIAERLDRQPAPRSRPLPSNTPVVNHAHQ